MRSSTLVSVLLLCLGCDQSAAGPDAGRRADAGPAAADAGPPTANDGGAPDAGALDEGGAPADAGSPPVTTGCGAAPGANDRRWTVTHDGRERAFYVHVPSRYASERATPVVLDFHGRNSSPSQQWLVSGMRRAADVEGFIAVHPEGVSGTWNGGLCCGEAMQQGVDDVGFVRALVERLEAELCVDARRVYATGLSNGGFMAHRLACELADRIAAVAPVAGPNATPSCAPSRPISVLHFHGTDDRIVPYDGFAGQLAVRPSMRAWAERNGCATRPATVLTAGDVTCEEWSGCSGGAEVRLCTVDGGGHQWPGGMTIPFLGDNTSDISATEAMWDFFAAHPLGG